MRRTKWGLVVLLLPTLAWGGTAMETPAIGPLATDPCDPRTTICLVEEFLVGGVTSGTIGNFGWSTSGGSTPAAPVSETNRLGILRRDTNSSATLASLFPRAGATVGTIDPSATWTMWWSGRLNQTDADVVYRVGLGSNATANPPTDGLYIEKLSADTNLFCVTRASSAQTRTDTGIAVPITMQDFTYIRTATALTIMVGSRVVCTHTETIPTVMLQPMFQIQSPAAGAKTADAEFWGIRADVTRFR